MMNHETATNEELELKLAKLTTIEESGEYKQLKHNGLWIGSDYPKYCTDWNVTMPLAVDYEISLLKANDGYTSLYKWDWIDSHWSDDMDDLAVDGDEFIFHADKDPLRAIVICLIKVLESKK